MLFLRFFLKIDIMGVNRQFYQPNSKEFLWVNQKNVQAIARQELEEATLLSS